MLHSLKEARFKCATVLALMDHKGVAVKVMSIELRVVEEMTGKTVACNRWVGLIHFASCFYIYSKYLARTV
jgi:hypothetical protein